MKKKIYLEPNLLIKYVIIMKKTITIKDMRRAISYVGKGRENAENWDGVSDEVFLNLDFCGDLHMGNIRMVNVIIELQRVNNVCLPFDVFRVSPDNRIKSFMDTVNRYIAQA